MIGYFYCLAFSLSIAASNVFMKKASYDTSLMLLVSSLLSFLVFGLMNLKNVGQWKEKVTKQWPYVLGVNVSVAVTWLCSYMYGLQYIDAATLLCIGFGTIPIASFLLLTPIRAYRNKGKTLACMLLLVMIMGFLIRQHMHGAQEVKPYLIGSLLAVGSGIGTACIGIFSEKLGKAGFSASQLILFRTPLLFGVALVLVWQRSSWQDIGIADLPEIAGTSFLASIVTVLLYKLGIKELGAFRVAMIVPFSPIFAYFLEVYKGLQPYDGITLLILSVASLTLLLFNISSHTAKAKPVR